MRCVLGIIAAAIAIGTSVTEAAPRRTTILTVVINGVTCGDHLVYLEAQDALVPLEVLSAAGYDRGGRRERIDGVEYVAVSSLSFRFSVDENRMLIELASPISALPESRLELGRGRAPTGLERRDGNSLYVNYGVHTHETQLDGFAETGLRLAGALAYSSVTLLPDHTVVRGLSNVTLDDRDERLRIVGGDHVVDQGPLGGGAVVGGAHLIRSFELDPYAITTPSIDMAATVLAPATAEIYVNGVLVRREQLAPGRYTLANLPVTTGAGDARVVIRDALGRQQELATNYYMPRRLLRPGLSDYHVAAGAIREDMGLSSFDYGRGVALVRYQRGLTSRLTVGVRAELMVERCNAGGSLVAGVPLGQIDAAFGASTDRGMSGTAASLAWSYTSRRGALSISGRKVSSSYATIDVGRDADRVVGEGLLQGSVSVARQLGVGAQLGVLDFRDAGWSNRMSIQATSVPARDWTLAIAAGRSDRVDTLPTYDVMATLSVALTKRTRGSLTQQQRGGDSRSAIDVHHPLAGREPGIGFRAHTEVGEVDRASGAIQAQTRSGRYEVAYTYDARTGGSTEVSAAGGLAVIGGRVFASTPIDGSFALVRVPGVSRVQTSLENHPIGRTDTHGEVFVPNLKPYYGNNVSIDASDVPFGRLLPTTRQIVAPPTGGGVIITFAAPTLHLVRGKLRIASRGGLSIPAYGDLSIGVLVSPIGSDGEYELDVVAGRHAASVAWDGGQCNFELVVPDDHQLIRDVGITVCAMPVATRPQ